MDTYNAYVKDINGDLQTLKRSGASYDKILGRVNAVIEKLEKILFYHSTQKNDLVKEKQKQEQFISNIKTITTGHQDKVKRSNESIESFSNMAKQTLSNTQFKKLADVKQEPAVENLFRFLYVNLYNMPETSFDFNEFKKIALKRDRADFQKRLALFSVMKLDAQNRDRLDEIKKANYSANEDNEDLYGLLAWLEYNYEAFVALKEREQADKMISDIKNKEKKYVGFNSNSQRLLTDLEDIIHYCEEHLNHLKLYQRKLSETRDLWLRNPNHDQLNDKMHRIFAAVDGFKGNEVMERLDIEIGNGLNGKL